MSVVTELKLFKAAIEKPLFIANIEDLHT